MSDENNNFKTPRFLLKMLAWVEVTYLRFFQDGIIFKPWVKTVEAVREPSSYGLKGFDTKFILTQDNVRLNIWEKPATAGRPTFIVFHGNTGHFGDVSEPIAGEPYFDRRYRVQTLKNIADSGSGIIAVSMRGYGASSRVKPSQKGYELDLRAVFSHIKEQGLQASDVILFGESMGAAIALMLLKIMNESDFDPKITALIASFSSIKNKAIDDHPQLSFINLEKYIRHLFDNEKILSETTSETFFYLFHPEEDITTKKYHSEKLFRIAYERGLRTEYQELKGAGHITWDSKEVVSKILEKYNLLTKKF